MPAGRTRACRPPRPGGQGQAAAAEGSLEAAEAAAIAAASAAAAAAAVGLAEAEQAARAAARAAAPAALPTAAEQEQVCSPAATASAPASHALSPRIRRPPRSTRPGWASARTGGMIGSVHLSRRSGAPAEAGSSSTSKSCARRSARCRKCPMSLSPRLGMRLRLRHWVSGMVRVGVEASDRYRTSVRGPDTQPPLRPRSPPRPHSHRLQAQAATEKASALTRSATVTAKEQREAAKELAKREAELAEAEDMIEARRWAYAVRWCSHRVWVSFYTIGCRPRSHHCAPWAPARARAARPRLKSTNPHVCAAPPGARAPLPLFALELPGLAGTARNLAGLTIRPMTRNDLNHKVKWRKGRGDKLDLDYTRS